MCSLFASLSFAAVISGESTVEDLTLNFTASFNFTTNSTGENGHFRIDDVNGLSVVEGINGALVLHLGFWDPPERFSDFVSTFIKVPLSNYTDFFGKTYGTFPSESVRPGDIVGLILPNGTGGFTYAVIFINSSNVGSNVTFYYKYNNQTGNNTFGDLGVCELHDDFQSCLNDVVNDCEWDDQSGLCEQFDGEFDFDLPPAECELLPEGACNNITNSICQWDAASGANGKCLSGPDFDFDTGFQCGNITNTTFCNNQVFTEKTGLCTWNDATPGCEVNDTKTFHDIPEPPAFFCAAPQASNNQTFCEELAELYFMPCGWDSSAGRCEDIFFDFNKFNDFEDIGSSSTCQSVGGTWKTETTYDPLNGKVSSESWCEFGVAVKTFDQVGAGGQGFGGNVGQLSDCSRDCFACEFQTDGSVWGDSSSAQTACESSVAGCSFRSDTNAFNGFGWCDPAASFGGFSCEQNCGDCMLMPEPNSSCINSPANCKWDNVTNFCSPVGQKTCNQECQQCFDQTSCQASPASGGCDWDTSSHFCKPADGKFEICFDGVDNDNNGKTDCEDFKCSSDPFCGGALVDSDNCFQYDLFTYQTIEHASNNCTGVSGCNWISEGPSFGFCVPIADMCFENATLQSDQSECEGFFDGETCVFVQEARCSENLTMVDLCEGHTTNESCMRANNTGCLWRSDLGGGAGECDTKAFFSCEMNFALQSDEDACVAAGCAWIGGNFGGGFEGGHADNCVTPCFNASINSQGACEAANGSNFVAGTCTWQAGFCEPKNFIGGCQDDDGDVSACLANTNCQWHTDPYGPIKDLNGSNNFNQYNFPEGETWLLVGLQRPDGITTGSDPVNASNYTLVTSTDWLSLYSSKGGVDPAVTSIPENVTEIRCSIEPLVPLFQYNWSTRNCTIGQCATYNNSRWCNDGRVHYFFDNVSGNLEVLWEQDVNNLINLDMSTGDSDVTNVVNFTTALIDGDLGEHINESATSLDGTNATRIRLQSGFCDGGLVNHFFSGMESNPPTPLASDATGDADVDYLDITGIGVKKTPEAYMYGFTVTDLSHSSLCKGVLLQDNSLGGGANTSKYFLYLDTDGSSTGGCNPENAPTDSSLARFEYRFTYVAQTDATTGKLSETLLSQACSSGSWIPTNIPFKTDKKKSCSLIGGPIFGIDKDTFTGKSDVNTSAGWAAYAVTAGGNGNASVINDSAGPGTADFKGIDVELIDCTSTADKDNSQCSKFKQFGFFPGEFGPACQDNIDNDGDGLTDCNDFDCIFDPFFCSGSFDASFLASVDDSTAPTIVWSKINSKLPDSLTFIFDTNEPSNGTVKFYNNDSTCASLNNTYLDFALEDGESLTNYRPHHVAEIDDLQSNTTYFYKLEVCDPNENCAVSKCSNTTTSTSHSNITFKLEIPSGWGIDLPALNLTNYSLSYALKASTEFLDDMNLTVRKDDNTTAITFVGVDIFEKQTLNVSQFLSGASFVGFDANQYQNFKQKTGLEKAVVKIPSTGTIVQHCDEEGENCQTVTDNLDCTFADDHTECEVPDAVGLGFSTYKATSSSSSSSSSSSGGGGGGGGSGGGGGGAAGLTTKDKERASEIRVWNELVKDSAATMKIDSVQIPVTEISFLPKDKRTKAEIKVAVLVDVPDTKEKLQVQVYEYLSIEKNNILDTDTKNAEIYFKVDKDWLDLTGVDSDSIVLLHYDSGWEELPTFMEGSDFAYHYYRSITPGFSYFAIASNEIESIEEQESPEIDEVEQNQPIAEDAQIPIVEKLQEIDYSLPPWLKILGFVIIILFIVGFGVLYYGHTIEHTTDHKRKNQKKSSK